MARVVVIGGSGHVGTYLVPLLVEAGHEVVNISRGQRRAYTENAAWGQVETVTIDREAAERSGEFGSRIAGLSPDVVIDMIAFELASTQHLVEALRGRVQHFLHCGTIWVYGANAAVPATEDQPLNPFGAYGIGKAAIETWLLGEAARTGFPATVFRPGHIVGPGWALINPAGNANVGVFSTMARGEALALPNFGLETVHHVHADDVARLILAAMAHRSTAIGEAFNAVSTQALNLKGYATAMYRWFGQEPNLSFAPFDEWAKGQTPEDAVATREHISRSPNHSMQKAERLLDFRPRHSSLDAIYEAVRWLVDDGQVERPPAE